MLYKNAYIFIDGKFQYGSFRVENGTFTEITPTNPEGEGIDLNKAYVIPGLVDVHIHGAMGADFSDGDVAGLEKMARYLAENGITSFAPASMTLPYETLEKAFATAERLHTKQIAGCAKLMGIHMEGPFFSEKKKGAQNSAYLQNPDISAFEKLQNGLIKIVDIAPELPGAAAFARQAAKTCTVSVAHTDANYEQSKTVFDSGATHLTHLFNAMHPIHHRNPGAIGAAAEHKAVQAELICDGQHVHESAVRMAFSLFPGRIVLVSDALRCCGMPDGDYELGGQQVHLENCLAKLPDGTIAGSATNLYLCMQNAVKFGISKEEAILSATLNPAKAIGAESQIGSIAPGKQADFLVCDADLNLREIYLNGNKIQ